MPAISLWQPWASALALGVKRLETRSYAMPRGLRGSLVAVHAAARRPSQHMLLACARAWELVGQHLGVEAERRETLLGLEEVLHATRSRLAFGAVVGVARFTHCGQVEEAVRTTDGRPGVVRVRQLDVDDHVFDLELSDVEGALGDFRAGRYVWAVDSPAALESPLSTRGCQGVWHLPRETTIALAMEWQKAAVSRTLETGAAIPALPTSTADYPPEYFTS
jgi:hypothetical protein